jgi:hypothetical protein
MTEQAKYMLEFLGRNYDNLVRYHLNQDDKIYLGDKENKVCRFCEKDKTETSFSNVSHAIPELIGNKKLIAHYECDVCNEKFSKMLESHFGNYMNLWHTISQVKGKKKIPSFKTVNDKSRIDIKDTLKIEDYQDDSIVKIYEENKTISITAKRRSYVPIAVYKTLTKMALTIMPEDQLGKFKNTLAWINEEDHSNSPYDLKQLKVLFSFAPGIKPFPFVSCMLFKRKTDNVDAVPYMQFLVAYSNFAFQIFIPLCIEDKALQGTEIKMTYIPTPLDINGVKLTRRQLDMHSKEKIKDEEETVTLGFNEMIEQDLSDNNE